MHGPNCEKIVGDRELIEILDYFYDTLGIIFFANFDTWKVQFSFYS